MLDKSKIKNIVQNLFEEKKVAGAAQASATWKKTREAVRAAKDADLKAVAPAAEEKTRAKIKSILDDAHSKLSDIFTHEATPNSVKKLDRVHRITSHLKRVSKEI